ncbi:MAG: hypothetical protein ABI036_07560 [Fibrobacteria bacterium]
METSTEKFLAWFCCAVVLVLGVSTLTIVVAPVIRHFLFAGTLFCTQVKAQVEEAYIVGSSRSVPHSHTGHGPSPGSGIRDLKFFLVARYQYHDKSYTTRTYALYNEDVSLPGHRGGGSDEEYFASAVDRLRQVVPNTAYTFLQPKESRISGEAVKNAMADIPEGTPHGEMDLKILKWVPGWNYYNMPFSDGIKLRTFLFLSIFLLIFGTLAGFVVTGAMKIYPEPKDFISRTWPGWAFGLFITFIVYRAEFFLNNRPPPEREIEETVTSNQIHRS